MGCNESSENVDTSSFQDDTWSYGENSKPLPEEEYPQEWQDSRWNKFCIITDDDVALPVSQIDAFSKIVLYIAINSSTNSKGLMLISEIESIGHIEALRDMGYIRRYSDDDSSEEQCLYCIFCNDDGEKLFVFFTGKPWLFTVSIFSTEFSWRCNEELIKRINPLDL